MGTLSATGEPPAIAEISPYVMSSRSGAVAGSSHGADEDRSARSALLKQLWRQCGSDDEEFETARTRPIWTEVSNSMSSADSPSEDLEILRVENQLRFQRLVERIPHRREDPCDLSAADFQDFVLMRSPFFKDSGGRVEAGRKIGAGGQAEIYEALFDGKATKYVLKVFRSDASLAALQHQWVTEIGRNYKEWKNWTGLLIDCCFVRSGTLLKDGRFAFVMWRYWGDLRKAIDLQIVKDKTYHNPPFPLSMTIWIMREIATGMGALHENGILHRDLKAANVLLNDEIERYVREEDIDFYNLDFHIADFESSEGVMGTRFWRAPEILLALKNRSSSDPNIWTQKVDVYSYAMTCYEVLTGCIPFQNRAVNDYDGVIGGERPPLPDYVDPELQELVRRCWHSEPSMRPSFKEIRQELVRFIIKNREFFKGLAKDKCDAEAQRWLEFFEYHGESESDDESDVGEHR